MKKDKEGYAGYVAEMFVEQMLKVTDHKNVCNFIGTSIDKIGKMDFMWHDDDDQIMHGDCKGSIMHPNCSVEADHPFFKQKAYENYHFIFPFRDETSVYVVNAHMLYEKVLKSKELFSGKTHDYYVVSPNDIQFSLGQKPYYTLPIVGKHKTFGMFFDALFGDKCNDLAGLSDDEVVAYVQSTIKPICENYFGNWDIPNN